MSGLKILSGLDGFDRFMVLVGVSAEEAARRRILIETSFMPFKVTQYYADLIAATPDPQRIELINIVVPPDRERPFIGRFDPYGNVRVRQGETRYIQHKYERTLLLHIDEFCVANCQFCYKVNEIRNENVPRLTYQAKLDSSLAYLDVHPEIDNVLFTGGDPAAFRTSKELVTLIRGLLSQRNIRVVRFATKGLAYDPDRFMDAELLNFLDSTRTVVGKQVSIIAHISHPSELSDRSAKAIRTLQDVGVQIRAQPAMIRGVNDSVETLVRLQRAFLDLKMISYYMTVFMPVRGVEQYAIRLHDAFAVFAESKRQLNGLEKKGILLAAHDFGKFEICGFLPSVEAPAFIVLKWHQAAMSHYLPAELRKRAMTRPEDMLVLAYEPSHTYCIDHLFAYNDLPYFDLDGQIRNTAATGGPRAARSDL
jgi:lysine 2,3-aminomutase